MTIKKKNEIPFLRDSLIDKGNEVRIDELRRLRRSVLLHIPLWLLDRVDEKVIKRAGLTRTAWILEAIQEKIERS